MEPSHVAARYGSVGALNSLDKIGFEIIVSDLNRVISLNFFAYIRKVVLC